MNYLILASAATEGGALTIIKNLYNDIQHDDNHFYIVTSVDIFEDKDNITIINAGWTKTSRFHRLFFDKVTLEKLVKEHHIDVVVSLQNTISKNKHVEQILYMHQPLPFSKKRYRFNENRTFWLYQNVIYKFIKKAIINADHVIVQTEWMKTAINDQIDIDPHKIIVSHPALDESQLLYNDGAPTTNFFYPAANFSYKNHSLFLEALSLLEDTLGYTVEFTLDDKDPSNQHLVEYVNKHNLNVSFLGSIPYTSVCEKFANSILVFPSEIETFGLPLLEARLSNTIILALRTPFALEILDGYSNAYFFDNAHELSMLMQHVIKMDITNQHPKRLETKAHNTLYQDIIELSRNEAK